MALADVAVDVSEPYVHPLTKASLSACEERFRLLQERASERLQGQGVDIKTVSYECFLNLRYQGSDTTLMIGRPADNDFAAAFVKDHKREFAFVSDSPIMVAGVRVRATSKTSSTHLNEQSPYLEELQMLRDSDVDVGTPRPFTHNSIYFEELGRFSDCPLYRLGDLVPGMVVPGPAIILDNTQTIVLHPQNTARILKSHVL
jgi:5-oxoprolinase (ATP-hydrolysing)